MGNYVVGEICDCKSTRDGLWRECTVLSAENSTDGYPYLINVPGYPDLWGTEYSAREMDLRKKRPPQQLDDKAADQEFVDLMSEMMGLTLKPEVEV